MFVRDFVSYEINMHAWTDEQISHIFKTELTFAKYYLKNEQECFIRFKATSAQREWL
jgi:hypothetical protein